MYVPLRVHGNHSLLTGVDAPGALLARARELGLPALALCDVDTTAGLVELLQAARQEAVRPILGAEISEPQPGGRPGRVIALVRDEAGYRNLCRLVSARRLGDDPGAPEEPLQGGTGDLERFDLASAVERFQAGLTFLVDHPRLVYALAPRLARRRLLVAIAPAALAKRATGDPRRVGPGEGRNAHLAQGIRGPRNFAPSLAPTRHGGRDGERAAKTVRSAAGDASERAKCPPPVAAAPAGDLIESARALGLAALAVPDVWYACAGGRADHAARVAIRRNALIHDLDPAWLAEAPAHLLSPAEMRTLYAGLPDARGPFPAGAGDLVTRTLAVAEECVYTPPLGRVYFPDVALEEGETAYSRLSALAFDGARRRYRPLRPEVVRRLDHELSTIERLGFAPYFLLVRKIADYARDERIPCVGRGSAADSLVAYCLELTVADPLRYRLPFERFLNPARTDRPDIDLDFCWRRRDDVLEHVARAFGPERTAMISTLNRFGLRSAFRETALAEGVPPVEVNRWSRRLPWYVAGGEAAGVFDGTASANDGEPSDDDENDAAFAGGEREPLPAPDEGPPLLHPLPLALATNPLARAFAATPECKGFPFDDPRMARVLRLAAHLFDTPRHHGLHPGGVVVSPGPITDFVSCQRAAKGCIVTQHDKDGVEALGLVKMDLLGNRALTVIADCTAALRLRGVEVDVERIPEDDPRTARMLGEGRTLGCFQVESPGMRHLLQQIGARNTDDCIQAVALIRPGPASSGMKDAYVRRFRGREEPTPPHPRLAECLWDTHGVMLYQEDVMHAAALIAGMELAEADSLRRALSARRGSETAALRERYFDGAAREGIARDDAARVWERIASFASFGFCKAHAVTYGRIAYQAVYLKAHYPAVYLTAFLNSLTGYYETRVYVEEARRLGVAILPPDVNKSAVEFQLEWEDDRPAIRVGLNRVKGLSQRALEAILAARERESFVSLPDFLARTRAHVDEVEHLIQCGAFDSFDRTRPEMLWRLHLLTTPARRPPRDPLDPVDMAQLAACRATPASRALESARDATGGWTGRGIGLGAAGLKPGETAALFGAPETPALALPRLPELAGTERGRLELALLGLTVSAHPSRLFPCGGEERLASSRGARPPESIPCGTLAAFSGRRVSVRGWLAASRRVRTADARWMRFLTLEDESGLVEVVLFPDVYERFGHLLASRGPFLISGTAEDQLGAVTLHAERVW
jgi:DNA-directed DNA polymerase III PolC